MPLSTSPDTHAAYLGHDLGQPVQRDRLGHWLAHLAIFGRSVACAIADLEVGVDVDRRELGSALAIADRDLGTAERIMRDVLAERGIA